MAKAKTKTDALRNVRQDEWPKGLKKRQSSWRFQRMVKGQNYLEVWGAMSEADAIRKAHRYNVELDQGRNPIQVERKAALTFRKLGYALYSRYHDRLWFTGSCRLGCPGRS